MHPGSVQNFEEKMASVDWQYTSSNYPDELSNCPALFGTTWYRMIFDNPELHWYWRSDPEWLAWHWSLKISIYIDTRASEEVKSAPTMPSLWYGVRLTILKSDKHVSFQPALFFPPWFILIVWDFPPAQDIVRYWNRRPPAGKLQQLCGQ